MYAKAVKSTHNSERNNKTASNKCTKEELKWFIYFIYDVNLALVEKSHPQKFSNLKKFPGFLRRFLGWSMHLLSWHAYKLQFCISEPVGALWCCFLFLLPCRSPCRLFYLCRLDYLLKWCRKKVCCDSIIIFGAMNMDELHYGGGVVKYACFSEKGSSFYYMCLEMVLVLTFRELDLVCVRMCLCACICALIHPYLWKYTKPA